MTLKNRNWVIVGEYRVFVQRKGLCEAYIEGIKEGDTFYTVRLDGGGWFDTKSQAEAEILSRLVRIENKLKEMKG